MRPEAIAWIREESVLRASISDDLLGAGEALKRALPPYSNWQIKIKRRKGPALKTRTGEKPFRFCCYASPLELLLEALLSQRKKCFRLARQARQASPFWCNMGLP